MRRFGKVVSYALLGMVLCLVVFALFLPSVFSGGLAVVRSSSMEPTMPAGALAMMVPIAPEDVRVGDIIAYEAPLDRDVTVSHRVVAVRAEGQLSFVTKGDAVEDADPFLLPASHVLGKVVFNIPYLGYVANSVIRYVRTQLGFVFLVCVPMGVLVASALRDVNRLASRRERRVKLWRQRQQRWQRAC